MPESPVSCTLIRVADPYATVAFLLDMVSKMTAVQLTGIEQPSYIAEGVAISDDCYVGAFAYIGKGAVIGKNVKIYPQSYVGAGVTVGDNSIIYPGVKIYHGCKVGKNCILHSWSVHRRRWDSVLLLSMENTTKSSARNCRIGR